MKGLAGWAVLAVVFVIAGEGINIVRVNIENWLAYGHAVDLLFILLGILMAGLGTAFLGGFIHFRDLKHDKIRREGWNTRARHGRLNH